MKQSLALFFAVWLLIYFARNHPADETTFFYFPLGQLLMSGNLMLTIGAYSKEKEYRNFNRRGHQYGLRHPKANLADMQVVKVSQLI